MEISRQTAVAYPEMRERYVKILDAVDAVVRPSFTGTVMVSVVNGKAQAFEAKRESEHPERI